MKAKHALAGALALAFLVLAAPVHAQSALEFAATGMGPAISVAPRAQIVVPLRTRGRQRMRPVRTMLAEPLDIRTAPQLVAVAQRYIGARRFTAHARAWCADALGVWLHKAGYSNTGDGRAISYLRYGRPAGGPRIGAIAVMRHHVGIVIGRTARGPVLLSGNHARRVGVGVYSAHRILAYREPV